MQDDINILKGNCNKTTVKGKMCHDLNSAYFPKVLGCVTTESFVTESFFSYDFETCYFRFFPDSFISPFCGHVEIEQLSVTNVCDLFLNRQELC